MTIKKNKPQATPEKEALDNKSAEPQIDDKATKETEKAEKVEDSLDKKTSSDTPEPTSTQVESSISKKDTPKQPVSQKMPEQKSGRKLSIVAIVIAVLFSGGVTYQMQKQNDTHKEQIAQLQSQISSVNQANQTLKAELEQAQSDTLAQAKQLTNAAEVALGQQQKSIESLQLAIADVKGRRPNDWLLAEADYLTKLAGRKLFLERDVVSATRLMESADQRISALNDPSLVPLRKAMAKDITSLKAVPLVDRDGLVLKLTALQQQVDQLPLANAILPEAEVVERAAVSQNINDWKDNLMTSLKDFGDNFITFRTRDGNVIPLLSPEQHFYLRENIKAKLETAIKAVYSENGEVYSVAISTANDWAGTFFDSDDNGVIEFQSALESLSKADISVEYPVKLNTQQILADVINERLRREVTTLIMEDK